MKTNWDRAIAHVLIWEGGSAVRANEPGGAVNRGVSLQAYREEHPGASIPDLLAMTDDEAKRIYAKNYAAKIKFDDLPSGYDVAMLHAAVMFGVNGAKKFHATAKGDLGYLVVLMMHNKAHRPQSDWHYQAGWSDRFKAVYELALELASKVQK